MITLVFITAEAPLPDPPAPDPPGGLPPAPGGGAFPAALIKESNFVPRLSDWS
jgi:hypothetical protein